MLPASITPLVKAPDRAAGRARAAQDRGEDRLDDRVDDRGFVAWSRVHAVVMLAGCAVSAVASACWPLSLVALLSVGELWRRGWGAFTPSGAFGWANRVTAFRFGLTVALGALTPATPGSVLAALFLAAAALDVADGSIARRYGLSSPFGAAFDIETDALMTLLITQQLWLRGRLGVWILIPGLLRYAYVLVLAIWPPPAGHVPSSRFARLAFVALIAGLLAALLGDGAFATALAVVGAVAVGISFARSFLWSYRRWSYRAG